MGPCKWRHNSNTIYFNRIFTITFLRLQNFSCFMKLVLMTAENCFPMLGIVKGCSSQSFSSFFWKFCQVNSIPANCFSCNKKHFLREIYLFIYNLSRFTFYFMHNDWFSSRGQKKHIKFSNFFSFPCFVQRSLEVSWETLSI